MTSTIVVELSDEEKMYLLGANFLPQHLAAVRDAGVQSLPAEIRVTPEEAEEFRAAFTEQLARSGFDQEYCPTSEGALLEGLIDKFFVR